MPILLLLLSASDSPYRTTVVYDFSVYYGIIVSVCHTFWLTKREENRFKQQNKNIETKRKAKEVGFERLIFDCFSLRFPILFSLGECVFENIFFSSYLIRKINTKYPQLELSLTREESCQ